MQGGTLGAGWSGGEGRGGGAPRLVLEVCSIWDVGPTSQLGFRKATAIFSWLRIVPSTLHVLSVWLMLSSPDSILSDIQITTAALFLFVFSWNAFAVVKF